MFYEPKFVCDNDRLAQLEKSVYVKTLDNQQEEYFTILKSLNFGKMRFGNLHPDYPVPSDCVDYIRDWMGTIPIGVLPLYARNGDDGITTDGIGIEAKTMIVDESLWELGPRGGIRSKCESSQSMGSYFNIGYGTDNGAFDASNKCRPTYVTVFSKQLGCIVDIFYLDKDLVVKFLSEYTGTKPKIHMWKILEHGTKFSSNLPVHGWDNYMQYLKDTLPKTGRRVKLKVD